LNPDAHSAARSAPVWPGQPFPRSPAPANPGREGRGDPWLACGSLKKIRAKRPQGRCPGEGPRLVPGATEESGEARAPPDGGRGQGPFVTGRISPAPTGGVVAHAVV